ncbi:MAG TPA: hypothetical protein ENJ42_01880, partial [Hellea balneolensis]|nr:hypothetical protein [Hellea balneolensis]
MSRPVISIWRYISVAIVFSALLCAGVYGHLTRLRTGVSVSLPVTLHQPAQAIVAPIHLETALNLIDLADMAGDNHFRPGDQVTVFLGPGPHDIWYPYAVVKQMR